MNDYYEVDFRLDPPTSDGCDLLADALGAVGFESFEPSGTGDTLKAFVPVALFNEASVEYAVATLPIPTTVTFSRTFVEGRDWNAEWEKNYFQPILIGSRVAVHSSFHTNVPKAEYDIVIDPKMAFGTGHHATTTLMIRNILGLSFVGGRVVDMGTGTGILAILCVMCGAARVTAVEIDGFAIENARENLVLNHADGRVDAVHGDASALDALPEASQDLFLANINRNIITGDIAAYARTLRPGGRMLLSGFYVDDIEAVTAAAGRVGLEYLGHDGLDSWACVELRKKP